MRSIDILPTVLDLLELDVPPEVEGTSFVPYFKNDGALVMAYAFSEKSEEQHADFAQRGA